MRNVVWTEDMLDYLCEHYANEPACDIADVLGVASNTVSKKAKSMGLEKSSSFSIRDYMGRYTGKYLHKRILSGDEGY